MRAVTQMPRCALKRRNAGVANRMMPSEITLPLAHGLVCYGVLRSRGGPLERAAARVCREAGATISMLSLPARTRDA